ncbi:hypothetical protein GXP67_00675 [Rhodocytophaga rosea]|uniref:Uncharacterized protein n=1 Tax=Rhodocytophaga rosea TaxID=2704465 RepID=A0A6C0GBD5_9BACT|nr:hypothetical protein [Rhodocytophaga rosea]QHT65289.1 hypothetical protein GXP67_00675 [Rhodocytophaga rosea]
MKKSIVVKRISYVRNQINNILITDFGLSIEMAETLSSGPDYSLLTGDINKVEHVNRKFEEIYVLEALLYKP